MADPNSGKIIWTPTIATLSPKAAQWGVAPCANFGTAPYDLENYSTDFRRVIATNLDHVGWIDTATGSLTDVTQMVPPPSPAFGQKPGKDILPRFDPSDDSFWFERVSGTGAESVMRLAPGSSRLQTVATITNETDCGYSFFWEVSKAGALIDLAALVRSFETETNQGCSSTTDIEVNPSGSAAFTCLWPSHCYVRSPLDAPWKEIVLTGGDISSTLAAPINGLSWISDDKLIFYAISVEAPVDLVTLGPTATSSILIQPVSATYYGFALGPDGKSLLFSASSTSASGIVLYKISLDGAGQPSPLPEQGLSYLLARR